MAPTSIEQVRRAHTAARKLAVGAPRFGVVRTARGIARLGWLKVRRPSEASAHVPDRERELVFHFEYPRQVMPMLVTFGGFIEPEFELFDRLLHPHAVFVDVGGGIGTYSVFAAQRTTETVHVFEPTPENAATIRRNAEANGVGAGVAVHEIALSDTSGFSTIVSGHNTFTNNVDRITESQPEGADAVEVTTLDEFCRDAGLDHVDILKIDVAGYERSVIGGATRLLSEQRVDVVTLELSLGFLDVYRQLERWGYRCCYTVAGRLVPIDALTRQALEQERPSVFHANLVAVSPRANPAITGG